MTNAPDGWDAWLASIGGEASFTQTSHWATINLAMNHVVPHWIEHWENGRRTGGVLLGLRKAPIGSIRDLMSLSLNGFSGNFLECAGGPIIVDRPQATASALLEKVAQLARSLRARAITFMNPPSTAIWISDPDVEKVFIDAGYQCKPWLTALVDIARPDAELSASFRQSARKGIRKCLELGITVRECRDSEDYLTNFSRPLFETRKAIGMHDRTDAAERQWWDYDTGPFYRYFLAQDNAGRVLGTLGTYRWNGVVTEIMSERTLPARESNVPVQDLLHWSAFVAHREAGDQIFDLAGFSPLSQSKKEGGIRSFKQKWQGKAVSMPIFERSSSTVTMRLMRRGMAEIAKVRTLARGH